MILILPNRLNVHTRQTKGNSQSAKCAGLRGAVLGTLDADGLASKLSISAVADSVSLSLAGRQ